MAKKSEENVSAATGAASNEARNSGLTIQEAMRQAAADAQAEGIQEPEKIRELMLKARSRAREELKGF